MPVELFGLSIGRAKKEALANQTPVEPKATSFVLPELDDAVPVDAGGLYGIGYDLDGSLRSEGQFISKYREVAMHRSSVHGRRAGNGGTRRGRRR